METLKGCTRKIRNEEIKETIISPSGETIEIFVNGEWLKYVSIEMWKADRDTKHYFYQDHAAKVVKSLVIGSRITKNLKNRLLNHFMIFGEGET